MDKYGRKDGWEMMRELADAESEIINDMRSPLAKARDEWLNSEEGKRCCEGTTEGQWLQNRLVLAFLAGDKFSNKQIAELEIAKTIGIQACDLLKERIEELEVGALQVVADSNKLQLEAADKIKELVAKLKEYGKHKESCAYVQGLRGSSIIDCDCGFEQALKVK